MSFLQRTVSISRSSFLSKPSGFRHSQIQTLKQTQRTYSSTPNHAQTNAWKFPFGLLGGIAAVAGFTLVSSVAFSDAKADEAKSTVIPASGLDPANFLPLKLTKIEKYNHDTSIFYFGLPAGSSASSALPVPSFVVVKANIDGKDEIRPYTPIDQHEKGHLKLLVKDYPTGKISRKFHTLKVGETLDIKGPLPKFKYTANYKQNIGMIAGGTGITPFLQVIEEIISNPNDKTNVTLIFANRTEKDILLKERLDSITSAHPNIRVIYTLDKPDNPSSWKGKSGFITKDLLKETLPSPSSAGGAVYICGPPPMMKAFSGTKKSPTDQGEVEGVLAELGYTKENVFKF